MDQKLTKESTKIFFVSFSFEITHITYRMIDLNRLLIFNVNKKNPFKFRDREISIHICANIHIHLILPAFD